MRKLLVALFMVISVVSMMGASCDNSNQTSNMSKAEITIEKSTFTPNNLNISLGTVVTWENKDELSHQLLTDGNLPELESGVIEKNGDFVFTFDKTGTFPYHCNLHPSEKGTVTVK